jgi:serine phosphatase RsbU (regulator of sigma subunit)
VLSQVITPLIVDISGITAMLWYRTWYNLLEAHTPYVFAISTFINVSTLERRVKTLSESALKAKLMEHEMALGKSVQDTFFRTPPMPDGFNLAISHRAEMYVSGDMIFSHHDSVNKTATALLCDVSGHGVQAALKASICSVLCDSIWDVHKLRQDDNPQQRLEILHRRATGFFAKTSSEPELLAVVGCEISIDTKTAYLYRANAVFPLIVSKSLDGTWQTKLVTVPNDTIQEVQLNDTSFILLFSDGFMDSSRTYKRFTDWLKVRIQSEKILTADHLKQMILAYEHWTDTHDDQTMCILEVAA